MLTLAFVVEGEVVQRVYWSGLRGQTNISKLDPLLLFAEWMATVVSFSSYFRAVCSVADGNHIGVVWKVI